MSSSFNQPVDLFLRDLHDGPAFSALSPVGIDRLSDSHPLKRQVVIVLDALESVTNGMENPEVRGLLAEVPDDSPFFAWKNLVYALEAFYRSDSVEMKKRLSLIPEGTAPKTLERLLFRLSGLVVPDGPYSKAEKEILRSLETETGPVFDAYRQIPEALDNGNEAVFSDSIALAAKELAAAHGETAKRLLLWALEKLHSKNMSTMILQGHLTLLFGSEESLRLASLSLFDSDPCAALVLWLRYSMEAMKTVKGEDLAALGCIGDYLAEAGSRQPDANEAGQIEKLASELTAQIDLLNAESRYTSAEADSFKSFLENTRSQFSAFRFRGEAEYGRVNGIPRSGPVQLELLFE